MHTTVYFRYYFHCLPENVKLIVLPKNNYGTPVVICWQVFIKLLPATSSYIITTDTETFITSVDCIVTGRTYCVHRKPFLSRNQHLLLSCTQTTKKIHPRPHNDNNNNNNNNDNDRRAVRNLRLHRH